MNIDGIFLKNVFFTLIFTLISPIKAANNSYKLEFVQLMYRHGDRAPETLYPKDPNPASSWPLGLGALTQLGKKEHYLLGKLFRKMYQGFYTTKPTEVDAVSTDIDRCISSAEVNFASFFAPSPEWKFTDEIDWQPIPITSIPIALDKYLGSKNCPTFQAAISNVLNSSSSAAYNAKHQKLYKYLTKNSGYPVNSYLSAHNLYDTLFIEKKYNLTIPSWVPPIFDELKDVAGNTYSLLYNSTDILQLRAGPALGLINKVFYDKMNKKTAPDLKFRTYSTHDVNIGAILGALKNLGTEIINYCSTLIFELYSQGKGNYFVRILFLNTQNIDKFNQTPRVILLPDCQEFCPYQTYLNYTNMYALTNYEKECDVDSTEAQVISDALSVQN